MVGYIFFIIIIFVSLQKKLYLCKILGSFKVKMLWQT